MKGRITKLIMANSWAKRLMASVATSLALLTSACSSPGQHVSERDLGRVDPDAIAVAAENDSGQFSMDDFMDKLDTLNAELQAAEEADRREDAVANFEEASHMAHTLAQDLVEAEKAGNTELAKRLRDLLAVIDKEARLEMQSR